jgi:Tfp pilus assembly protein PilW
MKLFPMTSNARRQRAGMSLLEVMIASSLGMIALAAVGSLSLFTARSFVASGNYADLDRASFVALDTLSRDVRQSRALTEFTTNKLTLKDNDNLALIYEYKPSTGQFTRQKNGTTTVLLNQCDVLKFAVYQRTPTNGWNWYPLTSSSNVTATAKLIDVSWKCSRKILGAKVNTESVQTAKVVIRN